MWRASLALLACAALAATLVGAQDQHPLTNMPKSGDVVTGFYFPDHPNKKFPAGELVKVVVGIHNDANEVYNITAITGSINSVTDFKMYVHNFTNKLYLKPVAPGDELSVEYIFQPAPQLPARDFIVALTLFYTRPSGEYLSTTFFNQTIEIVEKKQFIDFDLIFMYLILAGIVVGSAWLLAPYIPTFGLLNKKGPKKSASKGRVTSLPPSSAEKAAEDEDWIKGTPYDTFRRKKSATAEKSKGSGSGTPKLVPVVPATVTTTTTTATVRTPVTRSGAK